MVLLLYRVRTYLVRCLFVTVCLSCIIKLSDFYCYVNHFVKVFFGGCENVVINILNNEK